MRPHQRLQMLNVGVDGRRGEVETSVRHVWNELDGINVERRRAHCIPSQATRGGEQDFQRDSRIHKEANTAKHTSVGIRRLFKLSWADCDVAPLSSCEDTSSSQLDPWMTLDPWSEAACKLVTNGDCSATSRGLAADTMSSTCPLDVNAIEFVPDMPHASFDLSSTTVEPYIEHLDSLVRSQNSTIGLLMAKLEKFSSFPATLSGLWAPFKVFHMSEGESLDSEVNVWKAQVVSTGTAIASLSEQLPSAVVASLG